jgi:poly-gamma-glutamate capsule biosynthesis protein CapA/YwtB (metallophosphatase superfamily)
MTSTSIDNLIHRAMNRLSDSNAVKLRHKLDTNPEETKELIRMYVIVKKDFFAMASKVSETYVAPELKRYINNI